MTLTEAPPQPAPSAEPASEPAAGNLLTTADHKRIGRLFIGFSLLFLLAGGVIGGLLEFEVAGSGIQVTGNAFARLFSFHATVTPLLFLAPLWVGVATVVVLALRADFYPQALQYPEIAAALQGAQFVVGPLTEDSNTITAVDFTQAPPADCPRLR